MAESTEKLPCRIEGCGKPVTAKGLCGMHYARMRRTGDPLTVRKPWATHESSPCAVEGCSDPARTLGYCTPHYGKYRRTGDPEWVREPAHGAFRYKKHGCRCDVCTEGIREKDRRHRASLAKRNKQAPHGTPTAYSTWSCRCDQCREAWALYRREQHARDPEARAVARASAADWHREQYEESLPAATKHGQQWTGPELEMVLRDDLTVAELALALNRTTRAILTARHRARTDPKYVKLAGITPRG